MNIKKRLDREAKLTHQKILEDSNPNFLSSISAQTHETPRPTFVHRWKVWIIGLACSVSAVLIIVCAILLVPNKTRVIYYEENFETSLSDVVTLNADLQDFQFSIGEDLIASKVRRTVDGPSGDLLYYEMTLQTADRRIQTTLTIICNQNFNYDNTPPLDPSYRQEQLYDYPILYSLVPTPDPNLQFIILQAHAKIEGKNNIIYITDYQEVSLDENGSFLEFIQNLIKVKE